MFHEKRSKRKRTNIVSRGSLMHKIFVKFISLLKVTIVTRNALNGTSRRSTNLCQTVDIFLVSSALTLGGPNDNGGQNFMVKILLQIDNPPSR